MSEVIKPELVDANYEHKAALNRVNENGMGWGPHVEISEPTLEAVLGLEEIPSDLAWVSFYSRAVVRIRHTLSKTIDERDRINENVYGDWKDSGTPTQWVVDVQSGVPVFTTEAEILASGELTPFMRDWLTRVVDNPQSGSSEYWGFEELFGRSLV